ncbi:endonuclease/exonuclease/phosphatase family protein [Winogradskyella bathintestinalis]|uniref:Endonuclease/exonuclease/phosphatase domain-containing protein n=1 Tax=Winogradskyella bathintestinalis TaxID=3035208 RepID=A0ABT7ZTJ4_9FLAO|nr:endonuclease/exonuclease/phosphatase family protein [Winogradskyella bathintestinalis]MDN3492315.1 hypothetical protein [Winogradskyella bathintestinalis]
MKKKILSVFTIIVCTFSNVSSQETIKVMFYNLLNYPLDNTVPNRITDLSYILNDYQPDLFLVCELNNITGAIDILNTTKSSINSNYEMASYVSNTSDDYRGDQNDFQNLLYFNSSKFSIIDQIIVPTNLRDFNVYRVQLKTINRATDPIEIYIVIGHLKASSGVVNAQKRFEMIEELENFLDTLPANTNVLLGGDLNIYSANEAAFQSLLSQNNTITFVDPANRVGDWHNNTNFADVFTQSTRSGTNLGGSSGGFDDRFDFILTSESMTTTANITYVPNSYQVYGNNGLASCWNKSINSSYCETTGSPFSYELRNALYNFSDHLPVTMSLQTEATFLSIKDEELLSTLQLEATIINQSLAVNLNDAKFYNAHLNIYNNLGQKIKTFVMDSTPNQHFDVSDLQNGLYYLKTSYTQSNPIKFIISN